MSDRVSEVAAEYANSGRHDGAAMLYERALQMLTPFRRAEGREEAEGEVRVKAATEWFESLMSDTSEYSYLWRLWRGMRLAWDVGDLPLLDNFHDLHARHLSEGGRGDVFGGAKARVRRALTEIERLKRAEWDLGDRADNQEAWETVGSQLFGAHDLFAWSNYQDLANETGVLSEKAYEILRTV
jgi:hypothetical protein